MWAYRLEAPMRFTRHDVEVPAGESLSVGDVLLRFLAGGVCGSDVPRCRDGAMLDGPEPFGWSLHEIVGEVVASNADLAPGERVVGWVADSCGLREYLATPASQLLTVNEGLDHVRAVLLQPLACVLQALSRLPDITGARVAVIGLGPIGLLFAHALKDRGAASVVGVDVVDRSDVAPAFGVDEAVQRTSGTWARTLGAPGSFDLVVEAVGHQVGTLEDAITVAAPGGTVLYFGNPDDTYYPIRFGTMMDKNLTLRAGRTAREDRRPALRLAEAYIARHPGLPRACVTHVLPVTETQTAFEMASRPAPGQLKIVLDASA
ncbi:MAG: zinc-binding dehydrogenase [Nitriliruptorales bacterium]|nr:zinc-binding dehydrogenase [Nitriliruptorales bacterium]